MASVEETDYAPNGERKLREEWLCEQLRMWEMLESDLRRRLDQVVTPEALVVAKLRVDELVIAQKVLKNSYFAEELCDFSTLIKDDAKEQEINNV